MAKAKAQAKAKAKAKAQRPSWFGPDDTAACVTLERDVRAVHAWGDPTHPLFQEYVAREHLDGGMPVIELHRDHGIPLSAVRRWIATFEVGGRPALTRAAGEANAKAAKRKAAFAAKGAKPEELEALRKMIASRDVAEQRKAYAAIQKRSLTALVPEIVVEVRRKDRAKGAWSIQDELELLSAIGAKEALHELWTSKMKIMRGYGGWMSGLLRKAGCEIKTVERPWSEKYALDGKWWPIKR